MFAADAKQMREFDEKAIATGLSIEEMMAEAGKRVAEQAESLGKSFIVASGKGNNGGDGIAAAIELKKKGYDVCLVLTFYENEMYEGPRVYLEKFKGLGGKIVAFKDIEEKMFEFCAKKEVIIDAVLGFSLRGAPMEPAAGLINMINKSGKKVLAVDTPSGLNVSTGEVYHPCIKATQTLTLALPKKGFKEKKAKEVLGKIFLADIDVPQNVYQDYGVSKAELFKGDKIVPL